MTTHYDRDTDRDGLESAFDDAEHAAGEGGMLAGLARRLGHRASVRAVFGDPITQGDTTIVPVAKVRLGLGGGGGAGSDEDASGTGWGGGGGVTAAPVGYIVMSQGRAEFRPIRDPATYLPLLLGGAVALWIAFRALRSLWR